MERTEMNEETLEAKIIREKDEEINKLKDVIVDQAKAISADMRLYDNAVKCNKYLEKENRKLRDESYIRSEREYKVVELLQQAENDKRDTTKNAHEKEVAKIKLEAFKEVLDILNGKNEDCN